MNDRKERTDRVLAAMQDIEVLQSAAKQLPPEIKLLLLAGMGFVRRRAEHAEDCPSCEGEICVCIPLHFTWRAPADVRRCLKERWEIA